MRIRYGLTLLIVVLPVGELPAQSSSLYVKSVQQQARDEQQPKAAGKLAADAATIEAYRVNPLNPELEQASLFAVKTPPPKQFKVHDLITVIVREQKTYQSDSKLETRKDYEVESKIDEFFRFLNGHLAAASFTDGRPNIDFEFNTRLKGEGDAERNDKLQFRITVEILDIKPNGVLVLASGPDTRILVDGEIQDIAFTGACRSEDVTADNTVLSTQVFNQVIRLDHAGAVRDAAKRGWLLRLLDFVGPF